MVEVQLTGYQFCHYFFMCLSAKRKCFWHINNTTKGIDVLQILEFALYCLYMYVIGICISVTDWGYSTKVQVPCIVIQLILIHKSTCIVILYWYLLQFYQCFQTTKGGQAHAMTSVLVSRKECFNQEFGCLTMTPSLTYRT